MLEAKYGKYSLAVILLWRFSKDFVWSCSLSQQPNQDQPSYENSTSREIFCKRKLVMLFNHGTHF